MSHYVCDERLKALGGKAYCCDCSPHEDCTIEKESEETPE